MCFTCRHTDLCLCVDWSLRLWVLRSSQEFMLVDHTLTSGCFWRKSLSTSSVKDKVLINTGFYQEAQSVTRFGTFTCHNVLMTGQTWISSTQNTTMTQTNRGWVCLCTCQRLTDHSGPTLLLCSSVSVMTLATELFIWTRLTCCSVTPHGVICDKVIKAVLLILRVHWNENDSSFKIKWKNKKLLKV